MKRTLSTVFLASKRLGIGIACAVVVVACAGARSSSSQSDPPEPNFQLGDSVAMPMRAVNAGHESSVAFYLSEKDLLPESVAYDPRDHSFYVGSTRKGKIVKADASGNARDFIAPRQDGIWMVTGIKIHPTRRVLWACSWNDLNLEGYKKEEGHASGVFAFNLDTGKLIRKWVLDTPGEVHAFNDLVVTRGNDAYVTHMAADAAIYRITQKDQKLELFAKPEGLKEPNGIAISPDERTLFVAGLDGIMRIDIASGKATPLQSGEEPTGAIDGLYYFRGSLLAIRENSINRYRLDESNSRVVMTEVLEMNHPLMHTPTTGVIVDNDFYYVANGQFDALEADGSLADDKLSEPAILKITLR